MTSTKMYDAIVVGASQNGFAAAVYRAAKGWKVAVVEAAGEAGRAVKTREITEPGFRHDLFAVNLSMFAGSALFSAYRGDLTDPSLVPARKCFASVSPNDTFLGVGTDFADSLAAIKTLSQNDANAW